MLTRAVRPSTLKAWALRVVSRQGRKKAKVALARKLAVVMHPCGADGTTLRWGKTEVTVAARAGRRPSTGPARRSRRGDAWIGRSRKSGSGRFSGAGPRLVDRLIRSL
jgi:hypothetical protein